MIDEGNMAVLRRMAGGTSPGEARRAVPDTPARTLRLALARAAESALGLKLSVTTIADDTAPLDKVADRFTEDQLHIALTDGGLAAGYAVLDGDLRTAVVEMQLTGALAPRAGTPRPVTSADAALCAPLLAALISDLQESDRPGHFGPWVSGLRPGSRLADPRTVRMILTDGAYRVLEFGVDLGVEGRLGQLSLVLPDRQASTLSLPPPQREDWSAALSVAVTAAPADLDAVLHRVRIGLSEVSALKPGTVLPLHGVTVDSVTLEAPGRRLVSYGRLGQVAGLRAVRVTPRAPTRKMAATPISEVGEPAPPAIMAGEQATATPEVAMPGNSEAGEATNSGQPEVGDIDGIPDGGDRPDLSGGGAADERDDRDGIGDLRDSDTFSDPGAGPGPENGLPEHPELTDLPAVDLD